MNKMRWVVSTPTAEFTYEEGVGYSDNMAVLDGYMESNGNIVNLPSYPASIDYKRRDPKNRYWAALMYARDWWPENHTASVIGWEPVEPTNAKSPADARF